MENLFRIKFKPGSPSGSDITSDLLFGHLIWAYYYMKGDAEVAELIERFIEDPPFLLSSGFPDGYLPSPVIPPQRWKDISEKTKVELKKSREEDKLRKKLKWLSCNDWTTVQGNMEGLYKLPLAESLPEYGQIAITRNMINRDTNRVQDGNLFTETYLTSTFQQTVYIFVRDAQFDRSWFVPLLEYLECNGIGRDRSVGKGRFSITIYDLDDVERKLFEYRGKSFISLSPTGGGKLDPLAYNLITKYGRVGDRFSQLGINGKKIINKNPIVLYNQGASFKDTGETIYGRIIGDIHPDSRIVHYAYAFPLYFNFPGAGDEEV